MPNNHQRASDRFVHRWLRRLGYTLIPALLSAVGLMWADRAEKLAALTANTTALQVMTIRVTALEARVEENKELATDDRKEILDELKEMRKEVREMYRRAVAR
jgi:hypothetical protein